MLRTEKQLLGFYLSGHPLDEFKDLYDRSCDVDFQHLDRSSSEKEYTLIGQLIEWREIINRKGKKMAFGKVEAYGGIMDIVVFAATLESSPGAFNVDSIVFLRGIVDLEREPPSFKVARCVPQTELKEKSYRTMHIMLNTVRKEEDLEPLRDILFSSSGQCGVILHVSGQDREMAIKAHAQITCAPRDEVLERIRDMPVVSEVWLD